jgi:hypothetical protein
MRQRLRAETRDLLELVLVPGLAAILPWTWCFVLFRRMAHWQWLYRAPCNEALQQARARGWVGEDEALWLWKRRLVTLVDHADHYLGLSRSDNWMLKHVKPTGQWPNADQTVLLTTFHWGAGYWGLRSAAAHGLRPHALVATLESPAYQGRAILTWYGRSRNRNVARTLGAKTIDIAHRLKDVVRALRSNKALLGLVDIPADDAKTSIYVDVLGFQTLVPRGLLRLAVDHEVPVVLYITGLNTDDGSRFLHIQSLGTSSTVESLAARLFGELDLLIRSDAPAWHFWAIAERFFAVSAQ